MKTFWQQLAQKNKPFLALSPMEDVTDTVFRQIVVDCAPPDVFFTEFTSVDGLFSRGRGRVIHRLQFSQKEHPIIAQIWGMTPENYYKTAQLVNELGFDGIDINMGCPERAVIKQGACAALMKNRSLVTEIITATQKGAGDLPVSVKTRIGFNKIETEDWVGFLLQHHLDALTIHGRTAKEMSAVPAHWHEIGKAVTLRNQLQRQTIIIGNGDVKNAQEAGEKFKKYGVDGVMIGRGIFENLWAFAERPSPSLLKRGPGGVGNKEKPEKTFPEMLGLLRKHMNLFTKTWGSEKSFLILRKFFKIYVSGFPHASTLREQLMKTKSVADVEKILPL